MCWTHSRDYLFLFLVRCQHNGFQFPAHHTVGGFALDGWQAVTIDRTSCFPFSPPSAYVLVFVYLLSRTLYSRVFLGTINSSPGFQESPAQRVNNLALLVELLCKGKQGSFFASRRLHLFGYPHHRYRLFLFLDNGIFHVGSGWIRLFP